jgi:putative FmdB family regulatory protein
MPTYDYECSCCGPFEAIRTLAEYRDPQPCPQCGSASMRVHLGVAAFASMPSERRTAHAINERAAHEPKTASSMKHGKGCSCCSGASKGLGGKTVRTAEGAKLFPRKRPWMISH